MNSFLGQQFGNYRLVRHLGGGGFADVYLGQHVLNRKKMYGRGFQDKGKPGE